MENWLDLIWFHHKDTAQDDNYVIIVEDCLINQMVVAYKIEEELWIPVNTTLGHYHEVLDFLYTSENLSKITQKRIIILLDGFFPLGQEMTIQINENTIDISDRNAYIAVLHAIRERCSTAIIDKIRVIPFSSDPENNKDMVGLSSSLKIPLIRKFRWVDHYTFHVMPKKEKLELWFETYL